MIITPEEDFAVVVAALLAGRIDGQQAIASITAIHDRRVDDALSQAAEAIDAEAQKVKYAARDLRVLHDTGDYLGRAAHIVREKRDHERRS